MTDSGGDGRSRNCDKRREGFGLHDEGLFLAMWCMLIVCSDRDGGCDILVYKRESEAEKRMTAAPTKQKSRKK